jgi:type II secretory pathway predicted ATPase ExeA
MPQSLYGHWANSPEPHGGDQAPYIAGRRAKAIVTLLRGIHDREAVLVLTGASSGQSAVIGDVIAALARESIRVIRLGNPDAPRWSLRALIGQILGRPVKALTYDEVAAAVAVLLTARAGEGQVVIAVDEAQTLTDRALEFLLLLTSLVRSRSPLLQLILAGRGDFLDRQWSSDLRAVTGQVAVRVALEPLADAHAKDDAAFRLEPDGCAIDDAATGEALAEILRHSADAPRQIDRMSSAIGIQRSRRPLTRNGRKNWIASLKPAPELPIPAVTPIATAAQPVTVADRPAVPLWGPAAPPMPAATLAPECAQKSVVISPAVRAQGGSRPIRAAAATVLAAAAAVMIAALGGIVPEGMEWEGRVTNAIPPVLPSDALPALASPQSPKSPPAIDPLAAGGGRAEKPAEAAVTTKREAESIPISQNAVADASAHAPSPPLTQAKGAEPIAAAPTPAVSDAITATLPLPPAAFGSSTVVEAEAVTPLAAAPTAAALPEPPGAEPGSEAATATTAPVPPQAMDRPDIVAPPDAGGALTSPAPRSSPVQDTPPTAPPSAATTQAPVVGTAATPAAPNPSIASPTTIAPSTALAPARPAVSTPEMVAALLRRGNVLLQQGDMSAARLVYERAAASGSGAGATGAGKTYDPVVLARMDARGLRGDAALAADWYRKAIALGDSEAGELLKALSARTGP